MSETPVWDGIMSQVRNGDAMERERIAEELREIKNNQRSQYIEDQIRSGWSKNADNRNPLSHQDRQMYAEIGTWVQKKEKEQESDASQSESPLAVCFTIGMVIVIIALVL